MKRRIDGQVYDTDTATAVARSEEEVDRTEEGKTGFEGHRTFTLYRTPKGVFFLVTHETWIADDDWRTPKQQYNFEPLTPADAEKWVDTGEVEMLDDSVFPEAPEAEPVVETTATLYLRIPVTLKEKIEAKSRARGQAMNTWAIHCLEACVAGPQEA
jgi:hypothetical protein